MDRIPKDIVRFRKELSLNILVSENLPLFVMSLLCARAVCGLRAASLLSSPPGPLLLTRHVHQHRHQTKSNLRWRKYGAEEGHGKRNEAKKEHWIRKRLHQPRGGEWRESLGLTANQNKEGPMYELPDWSYADGRPGIPGSVNFLLHA